MLHEFMYYKLSVVHEIILCTNKMVMDILPDLGRSSNSIESSTERATAHSTSRQAEILERVLEKNVLEPRIHP